MVNGTDVAERFRCELDARFLLAARHGVVKTLRLATRRIDLHFAHRNLADRFSPALPDLEEGGDAPADYTIAVWDSDSTSVAPPDAPWAPGDIGPRGQIDGFGHPRFRAAFNLDSRVLSFLDSMENRAHFWTQSAEHLPSYECAAPLRTLLAWCVEAWGWQFAHAACVASRGRGVLLAGKGGSGKSTCALGCLGTALTYVADDYCLLSLEGNRPRARGVYATGKLDWNHLNALLPHLSMHAKPADREKATLYLEGDASRALTSPVWLEAIVLPSVSRDGTTSLTACSGASALTALAPSSVFQIPGLGASAFRFFTTVVERLPCYRLSMGEDLSSIRATLSTLLSAEP